VTSVVPRWMNCTSQPLELIDRIAALVPPPRTHRHRYFGVLAPNSPLRAQRSRRMAQALPTQPTQPVAMTQAGPAQRWEWEWAHACTAGAAQAPSALPVGGADCQNLRCLPAAVPELRWADAPDCVHHPGQRRYPANTRPHRGGVRAPAHIAPARGPPLWEDGGGDAQMDDEAQSEPDWATDWDLAAQPAPDFEVDQRISW
jgi:hypothetical protein